MNPLLGIDDIPLNIGAKNLSLYPYTLNETQNLYNLWLELNLKSILLHPQGFPYIWLKLEDIEFYKEFGMEWNLSNDPFANKYNENKIDLAKSILKNGTYFPCLVFKENNKYYIKEGKHRITALKMAQQQNLVPSNFSLFCIIVPKFLIYYQPYSFDYYLIKSPPLYVINIPEIRYGKRFFTERKYKNDVAHHLLNRGGFFINDYLIYEQIIDIKDMYESVLHIPTFMRDLLFLYNNKITPSPVLNNKEIFELWIRGEYYIF